MKKNIITVSREFGSGGRTVGRLLADKLNIAYYDAEIIDRLAEETGLSRKYLEENSEHAPGTHFFSYGFLGRTLDGISVQDYVWLEQCKLIEKLAEEGPCVIVGRCADFILREREDVLNVFVYAPTEFKAKHIVEKYGETSLNPEKRLAEKDRKRSTNYNYCTDRVWGSREQYDLMVNTGTVGIEKAADLIAQVVLGGE